MRRVEIQAIVIIKGHLWHKMELKTHAYVFTYIMSTYIDV